MAQTSKSASAQADTPTVTEAPEKKSVTANPKRTYPYSESKKIKLLWVRQTTVLPESGTLYNTAQDYTKTIGGAFAGDNNPTPLGRTIFNDVVEEQRVMSIILAAQADHPDWNRLLNQYWDNYRVIVPFDGLTLETGKVYQSEADVYGTPINPNEYVIWRYCLKYNRVSNRPEDRFKSPKILFYLSSEAEEQKKVTAELELRDMATIKRLEVMKDMNIARALLAIFNVDPEIDSANVALELARLGRDNPSAFISSADDKNLLDRAFLRACVRYGILKRPDNSMIYIYNGTQSLGSENEAIAYLNDPEGTNIKVELSARLDQLRRKV